LNVKNNLGAKKDEAENEESGEEGPKEGTFGRKKKIAIIF
jgi:hypothetical protein